MKKTVSFCKSFIFFFMFQFLFVSCFVSGSDSEILFSGEALLAQNKASVHGLIKNPEKENKMHYAFTENQKKEITDLLSENERASLSVLLTIPSPKKELDLNGKSFTFALLPDSAFSSDVKGNFQSFFQSGINEKIQVSISFDKKSLPTGFYLQSDLPLALESLTLASAKLGFSKGEVPLFALGPDGGEIDFSFTSADFSSSKKLFGENNSKLQLTFIPSEDIGVLEKQKRLRFSFADKNLSVRRIRGEQKTDIYESAFTQAFGKIKITELSEEVKDFLLTASDVDFSKNESTPALLPIPADPGLILSWNQEAWRRKDYELFAWEQFPQVLFFDFADYATQNKFFTRLAYFVEKTGYKGTLVDEDFVENKHGYNAHDYKADDLARFFTKVYRTNFPINPQEQMLLKILLANKIILAEEDGTFSGGQGSIISVSRESPDYLRYTLVAHESWHGIYFSDEDFRNTVFVSYSMFDPESMEFLKTYWETQPTLSYDRSDEFLMRNEFMAYLMQQPVSQIKSYWTNHAKWNSVQKAQKELADYIILTDAQAFEDAANFLASYAFDRWGLNAGRVNLVSY